MKCLFLFIICFFLSTLITLGQTKEQFNASYQISGLTTLSGDQNYRLTGIFSDISSTYTVKDVQVGDKYIDSKGYEFGITSIVSALRNNLIVEVKALNSIMPSTGEGILYRPTEKGYALITSPDQALKSATNTNILSISADLPNYSSGPTLPIVSSYKEGDVVQLSTDFYKLTSSGWNKMTTNPHTSLKSDISSVAIQAEGYIVYLRRVNKYYYSDGTQWILISTISSLPDYHSYGDVFYNTTDSILYMMSAASKWLEISSDGSGVTTGTVFPSSPDVGNLFYNTSENILYFYNEGNEWVEVSIDGSVPEGIMNPGMSSSANKIGHLFYNTSENKMYVYNGTTWVPIGNDLDEGHIFVGDTTDVAVSVEMSGDAKIDKTGKLTIEDDAVTDAKLDKASIPLSGFGNAEADVSMGTGTKNYKITNLKTPTNVNDAANKAYVDVLMNNPADYLPLNSGYLFVGNNLNKAKGVAQNSIALSGFGSPVADISMNGQKLTNVATPTDANDVVNKNYVDTKPIVPKDITLPYDMMMLGNLQDEAAAVEKYDIPFSEFGAATKDVKMGDGTNNFRIIHLADPTDKQDAATKIYVDDKIIDPGKITLKEGAFLIGDTSNMAKVIVKDSIPLSGFAAAMANVDLGSNKLVNVALPDDSTDVVNKKYVDSLFAHPDISLALPNERLLVGGTSGKAEAVEKGSIPVSDFGMAAKDISMGDAVTQHNIKYVADPLSSTDVANKNYVDQEVAASANLNLADGKMLVGGSGGKAKEVVLSGDATLSNMGALTIANDAVHAAKINADVAGNGLTKNPSTGALDVDVSTIAGRTISSTDLDITGGATATLADVSLAIANGAVTNAKLDKSNIPISGFSHATADIEMGNYRILNLKTPGKNDAISTAATKGYVDNAIDSLKVPGNLYQGTVADVSGFLALTWATVSAATDLGFFTVIPKKICDLSTTGYTWIAYPAAWDRPDFFYQYDSETYAVFDGLQKRIIPAAKTGSVDYQLWVFKTTPDRTVSLITQN